MKIIDQFKDAKTRLYDTIYRFPFTTIFLSAISLISIYFILASENDTNLLLSLLASTLITFLFELAYEYDVHKIRILSLIIGLVTTFLSYVVLSYFDNIYVNTGLAGICIATISLIFYILYKNKENKYIFSYLIKTYFITSLFTSVVYSGFLVVLLAFNFLIFSFNDVFKLISILAILILFLIEFILLISYVPKKDEIVTVADIYRSIIHKALFYIYLLLIAILYLYILKIVVTWTMPVGKLNWFGCFALLFYVFFYLSVDEQDGEAQTLFKKHGALLLVPVLAIQLIAIGIRVSAYGLTTARFMSIILVLIAIGFMAISILKLPIKYAFLFMALVSMLFSCTPLNIFDVPNRNQENRLLKALVRSGAYKDGKIIQGIIPETEDCENAKAAADYLYYSAGNKSEFYSEFEKSELAYILRGAYPSSWIDEYVEEEILEEDETEDSFISTRYFDYYSDRFFYEGLDISQYKTMKKMHGNTTECEGYDLTDYFMSLEEGVDDQRESVLKYQLSNNQTIIFEFLSFQINEKDNTFENIMYDAYILEK